MTRWRFALLLLALTACHSERADLERLKRAPTVDALASFIGRVKDVGVRRDALAALEGVCQNDALRSTAPFALSTCVELLPSRPILSSLRARLADLCESAIPGACVTVLDRGPADERAAALGRRGLGSDVVTALITGPSPVSSRFVAAPSPKWPFAEVPQEVFVEPVGAGSFAKGGAYRVVVRTNDGGYRLLRPQLLLDVAGDTYRVLAAPLGDPAQWALVPSAANAVGAAFEQLAAEDDEHDKGAVALLGVMARRECARVAQERPSSPKASAALADALGGALGKGECVAAEKTLDELVRTNADESVRARALIALSQARPETHATALLVGVHRSLWKDKARDATCRQALALAANAQRHDAGMDAKPSALEAYLREVALKSLFAPKDITRLVDQIRSQGVSSYALAVVPDLVRTATAAAAQLSGQRPVATTPTGLGPTIDVANALMAQGASLMQRANAVEQALDGVTAFSNAAWRDTMLTLLAPTEESETVVRGVCRAMSQLGTLNESPADEQIRKLDAELQSLATSAPSASLRVLSAASRECAKKWVKSAAK